MVCSTDSQSTRKLIAIEQSCQISFHKTADDCISIKFCTPGRYHIYGIYTRRDLNLVGVRVQGNIMFALDDCDLHPSYVPDLEFRRLRLGIRHTPLATRETPDYTKECICSAISTLSLGYTPLKKIEWCYAVVLLTGITSEAVRFPDMSIHIQIGLHSISNSELHNGYVALQKRWNKVSMAIRRGEYPYIFSYFTRHDMFLTGTLSSEMRARSRVSLINDKDKTKIEKLRRRNDQGNGQIDNSIRKLREEHKRNWLLSIGRKAKTNNEHCVRIHGFWYGSVGNLNYEPASMKCLLRPTQMVRASRHFIPSLLDCAKAVLQIWTTRAFIFPVMQNMCNTGWRPYATGSDRILGALGPTCLYPLHVIRRMLA